MSAWVFSPERPPPYFQPILAVLSVVFFVRLMQKWSAQSRKLNLPFPPGPKPKLIVGNLFDLPIYNAPNVYMEWEEKYQSGILYADAWGDSIVILNKREDMEELFERRSSIYSDRPNIPIVELLGWSWNLALHRYGPAWRLHRKLAHQALRQSASRQYEPIQLRKVHDMLCSLLHTPDDFLHHGKLLSISILMSMMYGYDVRSIDEPCVQAAEEANHHGAQLLLPGATLVNLFPSMRHLPAWFPGCGFHHVAAKCQRLNEDMRRLPMEYVTEQIKQGTAKPSFITDFLLHKMAFGASDEQAEAMPNVASTVYSAASETTESTFGTIFYLLVAYPDTQRKLQEEIDRIIGQSRLPELSDRPDMPYSEAFYREVLRWRPALQLLVPHRATEDDTFKGYFIPKGTTVIPNIWAMTRNVSVYSDPDKFQPERFFDKDGKLNDDETILAYGLGRRGCVGKHVASASIWLFTVSFLAVYNIEQAEDEDGNLIPLNHDYEDFSLVCRKVPFKAKITPRSEAARKLVEALELRGQT